MAIDIEWHISVHSRVELPAMMATNRKDSVFDRKLQVVVVGAANRMTLRDCVWSASEGAAYCCRAGSSAQEHTLDKREVGRFDSSPAHQTRWAGLRYRSLTRAEAALTPTR
jgi:hypothetical protein